MEEAFGTITEAAATIRQTLADYYKAFSTLEIRAILRYFHEPAMLMGPPGVMAAPTRGELATLFVTIVESLKARGYGRSELDLREVKVLSANAALARGVALRYKADGQELERIGVTYLLHKVDHAWKIAVMVLHDSDTGAGRG